MPDTRTKEKDQIIKDVRAFIINNFLFGNDSEMVTDTESFMENGIIDSTGILELIEHVEESYNISVEDEELLPENLDSLMNISSFIISKNN